MADSVGGASNGVGTGANAAGAAASGLGNAQAQASHLASGSTPAASVAAGPTQAEALANANTPATTLAQGPTQAEMLAQAPAQTVVSALPARPDLTGPTQHTTTPTPGATYQPGVTADDIAATLQYQDGYARYQWANGQGVVGPVGSEQQRPYAGYNNPADPQFSQFQQFGYHHDLQTADAQLQTGHFSYEVTRVTSALRGIDVLHATGDVDRALAAARREWYSSGFDVRTRY